MAAVLGYDIGVKICEIFGLQGQHVRSLYLSIGVDEPVTLTIERMARESELSELVEVLEIYELHRKEDSNGQAREVKDITSFDSPDRYRELALSRKRGGQ